MNRDTLHSLRSVGMTKENKMSQIRARREARGFSDGSVQVVRDQAARNSNTPTRQPYPNRKNKARRKLDKALCVPTQSPKTVQMRAVQGVVSTPTGVYIDAHELGARSNNAEMRSISAVFFKGEDRYRLVT